MTQNPDAPQPGELTDLGRQSGHVLLDMLVSHDPELADPRANFPAARTAFQRLNEIGAVTATRDDETETTTVNVSDLIAGTLVTMNLLVALLARKTNSDPESVIAAVRTLLDEA